MWKNEVFIHLVPKAKQQYLKLNAHSHFSYLKPNKIKNYNTITGHGTIRLIFYLASRNTSRKHYKDIS